MCVAQRHMLQERSLARAACVLVTFVSTHVTLQKLVIVSYDFCCNLYHMPIDLCHADSMCVMERKQANVSHVSLL